MSLRFLAKSQAGGCTAFGVWKPMAERIGSTTEGTSALTIMTSVQGWCAGMRSSFGRWWTCRWGR